MLLPICRATDLIGTQLAAALAPIEHGKNAVGLDVLGELPAGVSARARRAGVEGPSAHSRSAALHPCRAQGRAGQAGEQAPAVDRGSSPRHEPVLGGEAVHAADDGEQPVGLVGPCAHGTVQLRDIRRRDALHRALSETRQHGI